MAKPLPKLDSGRKSRKIDHLFGQSAQSTDERNAQNRDDPGLLSYLDNGDCAEQDRL